jgi:hypothetical protein
MKCIKSGWDIKGFKFEDNDCSVHALRHAFNLTYGTAHSILRKHGRKNAGAFDLPLLFDKLILYNDSTLLNRKLVKINYYKHLGKACPLKEFVGRHGRGTYILNFKNHVACLKDGIIYDSIDIIQRNYKVYSAHRIT